MEDMPRTSKHRLEWEKNAQRRFIVKVSKTQEPELVQYMESLPNYSAYVKDLVRQDMLKKQN